MERSLVYNFSIMKLYQEKTSVVYFGQIDNPYDNYLSERLVLSFLKNKKGRVLDLGCGAGRNTIALIKMGFEVVSIDSHAKPLEIARSYAKKHRVENKVRIIKKDITKLKNGEFGKFDFCILQEVIEHMTDYQKAIDFAYSSLKKGGILIMSTQYNPKLWNTLDDYAGHVKRFTKTEIEKAVEKFKSKKIIISGFPVLRSVHFLYSLALKLFRKKHNTPEFVSRRGLFYAYTLLFPHFLKIDRFFDFTEMGKEIMVYAEK
jgi:2-polyprenyl-3-methyl-5-hydroxy-6-metoxy-1,4-benzoquinol methylase